MYTWIEYVPSLRHSNERWALSKEGWKTWGQNSTFSIENYPFTGNKLPKLNSNITILISHFFSKFVDRFESSIQTLSKSNSNILETVSTTRIPYLVGERLYAEIYLNDRNKDRWVLSFFSEDPVQGSITYSCVPRYSQMSWF